MEHRIVIRHRTVDKSVSTCDIESVTGFPPTSKDEPPEDVESESIRGERVVDGSPGNEVNDDFQVGQVSAGSRGNDALTGCIGERTAGECVANVSVNDRKTRKEQLKSLVDLIAGIL